MADVIVTSNQTLFGKDVKNVLCFGNLFDDPIALQNFADNFRQSYVDNFVSFIANDWFLNSLTFSFIDTTNVLYSVEYDFTDGFLQGTSNADNLTSQSCLLVSTQRQNTKPNRGRVYLAGVSDSQLVAGLWLQAALDAAEDLVQSWVDGVSVGGSDANLRILRRPSAVFPTFVSNSIDSVIPRRSPATQRNRRLIA